MSKAKGDAAFKAQNYATAVGHYAAAIIESPLDPIPVLNRAAAYLKLNKYQDAERDCTRVLELDKNSVKALWRRASARKGLQDLRGAQSDLRAAASLEPKNEAVEKDLADVSALISKAKGKAKAEPQSPTPTQAKPVRKRIPIEIVYDDDHLDKHEPQKSLPKKSVLKKNTTPNPQPVTRVVLSDETTSESTPASFQQARVAREASRPTRVGGGIFRVDGTSKVIEKENDSLPVPKTLFQLERRWNSLNTTDAKWKLLQSIPPDSFPRLAGSSLESDLLGGIIETLHDKRGIDNSTVASYAEAIRKVTRINTITMFMSSDQQRKWSDLETVSQ